MRYHFLHRSCAAAALGLTGVFLSVRCKAFLINAYHIVLPQTILALLILGFAVIGFICEKHIRRFLLARVRFGLLGLALLSCLSILFVAKADGFLLDRPLAAAEVTLGAPMRLLYLLGGGLLLAAFLVCTLSALRDRQYSVRRFWRSVTRWDLLFLLFLALTVNAAVFLYAKNSSTIYFWDNAGYWTVSSELADLLRTDGAAALLRVTLDSVLTLDYNYLIILPIVFCVWLFGRSRYVFLAAIANLYLIPLCILVWAYAKSRFDGARTHKTLCTLGYTTAVLLSAPILLSLTMIGFVDVGGCTVAFAAMLIMLTSHRGDRDFGRFFLAGILLALSLLLRRWFAFFALAFVLAELIDGIFFKRSVIPLLGTLSAFSFTLLFFFEDLVSGKLLADYGRMYEAYAIGLDKDFLLLFRYFGFIMLLAAIVCAIFLMRRPHTRPTAVFALVQAVLCFILFVGVQTHGQQHLLLYVPAYLGILITALSALYRMPLPRVMAWALLPLFLFPTLSPFLPRIQPQSLAELKVPTAMPSFSWSPPQREDAAEIVNLIRRLDQLGEEGYTVGVLASSLILNDEILRNAEASLSLPRISEVSRDYLLYLPAVDQRDGFSDVIFHCDAFVVADPIQLHLGEDNQSVVAYPAARILSGEQFGRAFCRLEEEWLLRDGVKVYIYIRTRPNTEAEADELRAAYYALHPAE